MKFQPATIHRVRTFVLAAVMLLLAVAVICVWPGRMEGQYRDAGVPGQREDFHFLQFRQGQVIRYDSARPPAELIGRYFKEADGSTSIYHYPSRAGQAAELAGRAYPRLGITKFVWAGGLGEQWAMKRPRMGAVGKAVSEQQVTSLTVLPENARVLTFHDPSLKVIRQERLPVSGEESPPPSTGGDGR